jgi:hypothetical protein
LKRAEERVGESSKEDEKKKVYLGGVKGYDDGGFEEKKY